MLQSLFERIPVHYFTQFAPQYTYLTKLPVGSGQLHETFQIHSRREARCRAQLPASSSDYFKITLITQGTGRYYYGDQCYEVAAPALVLTVPAQVKSWQSTSGEQDGYFCIFNEQFLPDTTAGIPLYRASLFQLGASPVVALTESEAIEFQGIFERMQVEYHAEHANQREAIQLYLQLILLQASRLSSSKLGLIKKTAATTLAERFLQLLASQFPVLATDQTVVLTTPALLAAQLAVHPTYLNTCVRSATGRTVSEHIREHQMREAKRLLRHTSWPVAWVAAAIGYADAAYFSRAFKAYAGYLPRDRYKV